jgi:hypothetical protein
MAETYGTNTIPSDQITVRSGGTTAISAAFESTVGLVGGMNTSNGSANAGDVVTVESTSDADDKFGADSELAKQAALAFNNGVSTIYAVGVTETSVTDEQVTQSDTLSNPPVFDPNVNPEHSITAQDTGGTDPTVNIVYASPPSTPSDANTANVNPVTGEIAFDAAADTQYEVDYDYGDYSSAITDLAKKVPRFIVGLTENTSVANTLLTEVNAYDTDFDFMHAVAGAMPEVSAGSYSDTFDDRRMIIVAPSRAFTDSANNTMVRTMGAVGGLQAGSPLGDSTTYESLGGFADLNTQYTNSELGTLIDAEVYPIKQGGGIQVVKDMTTSQDAKFERVYASEIVDEVTEISHQISQQFIGRLNTDDNRTALEEGHNSAYGEMVDDNQLDDYFVNASLGANDDEVDLDIAIDVVDVMDLIDVTITVGDIITNGGAS